MVPVGPLRAWVLVIITCSVQAVVTDWTVVGFVRGDVLGTEVAGWTYGAVGLTGDVVVASRWTGQGCGGSLWTIVADRTGSSNGRIRTLKRDVLIQVLGLACYILKCNRVESLRCWWLIWPIQNDAKKTEKWLTSWQMGTHQRITQRRSDQISGNLTKLCKQAPWKRSCCFSLLNSPTFSHWPIQNDANNQMTWKMIETLAHEIELSKSFPINTTIKSLCFKRK